MEKHLLSPEKQFRRMLKQQCVITEWFFQCRHYAGTCSQALTGCGRKMKLQIGIAKVICQFQTPEMQEMGTLNSFREFLLPF